jgi:hypothetical protein
MRKMNKKELEKLYKDFTNLLEENAEVSNAFDFAYAKEKKSRQMITLPSGELLASKFSSYIEGYLKARDDIRDRRGEQENGRIK